MNIYVSKEIMVSDETDGNLRNAIYKVTFLLPFHDINT